MGKRLTRLIRALRSRTTLRVGLDAMHYTTAEYLTSHLAINLESENNFKLRRLTLVVPRCSFTMRELE